jgi:hypothetical protein
MCGVGVVQYALYKYFAFTMCVPKMKKSKLEADRYVFKEKWKHTNYF